jgi:hypothetical protein
LTFLAWPGIAHSASIVTINKGKDIAAPK